MGQKIIDFCVKATLYTMCAWLVLVVAILVIDPLLTKINLALRCERDEVLAQRWDDGPNGKPHKVGTVCVKKDGNVIHWEDGPDGKPRRVD
jgi:hypothetical protein